MQAEHDIKLGPFLTEQSGHSLQWLHDGSVCYPKPVAMGFRANGISIALCTCRVSCRGRCDVVTAAKLMSFNPSVAVLQSQVKGVLYVLSCLRLPPGSLMQWEAHSP